MFSSSLPANYFSPPHAISTNSNKSQLAPIRMPAVIQINGRKVLGPPLDWQGPPPSNACELFLKRIPRHITEETIIPWLVRFGPIYEFRLMLEFTNENRGYAFVRYTNEVDAKRALLVLRQMLIGPGRYLEVQRSFDKCRLFIGNIPKQLSEEEVESGLRSLFPSLERILFLRRISDGTNNRGFVFIDFPSHQSALEVKKIGSPGRVRMWDANLRVVWANPQQHSQDKSPDTTTTLFVRNVDMAVPNKLLYQLLMPIVDRTDILKLSRDREFAFIELSSRDLAEKVMYQLQGVKIKGYPLKIEWALPSNLDSVHTLCNCDFDAMLRIKCIANWWSVPVIIFGRIFDEKCVQYAAIMIRNGCNVHSVFFQIYYHNLPDIQSRLCEVFLKIIESCGGLPQISYVMRVCDDKAKTLGAFRDIRRPILIKARPITENIFVAYGELMDLCLFVAHLAMMPDIDLHREYSLALTTSDSTMKSIPLYNSRVLKCLNPIYRCRPPLEYSLDNRQLIFILCSAQTQNNFVFDTTPYFENLMDAPGTAGIQKVPFVVASTLDLLPLHMVQMRNASANAPAVRFG